MNLPNILTVSRLFLTIGFAFSLTRSNLISCVIAIALFIIASLTDYYDGYYAKKLNLISNFGKIMDPIADKFLILAAFFIFFRMNIVAGWMFYIILIREFIITGTRFVAMSKGKILAAERSGKCKTVLQIFVISVILIFITIQKAGISSKWNYDLWMSWNLSIQVLMFMTVGLTLSSGISYLWNNRKTFLLDSVV